jgi:hypothetical protein
VSAAERRRCKADLQRRRCPECRERNLTHLPHPIDVEGSAWCESCGWTGKISTAPYRSHYAHLEDQ